MSYADSIGSYSIDRVTKIGWYRERLQCMVLLLLITGWCVLYQWASNTLKRQSDVGPVNADVIGSYSRGGKGCWCEPWKWAPFQPLSDLQLKQGLQHFINSLYSFNHSFTIFIHLLIHSPWTGTTALHKSQFIIFMHSLIHAISIHLSNAFAILPYFQFSIKHKNNHSTSIHYIHSFPIFTRPISMLSIFNYTDKGPQYFINSLH